MKLYRWVIVFLHAAQEQYRWKDQKWFEKVEDCLNDADQQSFDYCCGYNITVETIETRDEPEEDVGEHFETLAIRGDVDGEKCC